MQVVIDLGSFYEGTARLASLGDYCREARRQAGRGHDIVLTGPGPIWMYLSVAHALHGVARRLVYRSPVAGDVTIFDHDPG